MIRSQNPAIFQHLLISILLVQNPLFFNTFPDLSQYSITLYITLNYAYLLYIMVTIWSLKFGIYKSITGYGHLHFVIIQTTLGDFSIHVHVYSKVEGVDPGF